MTYLSPGGGGIVHFRQFFLYFRQGLDSSTKHMVYHLKWRALKVSLGDTSEIKVANECAHAHLRAVMTQKSCASVCQKSGTLYISL